MNTEVIRALAPVTQGMRDVNSLLPGHNNPEFSGQVADVVAAQDELKRQKDEGHKSLWQRALINTGLGAVAGGLIGGTKSIPFTRELYNPWSATTLAGAGAATALAFTLGRHALQGNLENEAKGTIADAPEAVKYVASHPATRDKAREYEQSQWAPYGGAEAGALVGGTAGLLGSWALGGSNAPGDKGVTAAIGAGVGSLTGLGLGYLYRKYKQKQFLEHIENELSHMPSPKAQEAVVQSAVEQEPLQKAAKLMLDIVKGDTLLGGKFKNVPMEVTEIGTDELGQPTVNGKKLLAFRIEKKMPGKTAEAAQSMLELYKAAYDGVRRPPTVSTNAPLLRGMGGPPDRYASTAGGARRVYDYGMKAVNKMALDGGGDDSFQGSEPFSDEVAVAISRLRDEQLAAPKEPQKHEQNPADQDKERQDEADQKKHPPVDDSQAKPSEATAYQGKTAAEVEPERANLPYRKRVEIYPMKGNEVYGGVFKDGAFGAFGGGLDGDDIMEAAQREFLEETGLKLKNPKLIPVEPLKVDWVKPFKSDKQKERAKDFRGSQTFYVIGELDDSEPVAKAKGDDGKSPLKKPGLYCPVEAHKLCVDAKSADDGSAQSNAQRIKVMKWIVDQNIGMEKQADEATFLPRKEVFVFNPAGKLAIRRTTNRRFDLPSDVMGTPVPYEQPVQILPEGGVPEPGVHGYSVSLHSADAETPEGYEQADPQDILKDLYASLGKPENRAFQALDRTRARSLLRLLKKRPSPVSV